LNLWWDIETSGSAVPEYQDTNVDFVEMIGLWPKGISNGTSDLPQITGIEESIRRMQLLHNSVSCQDCCIKVNIDQIKVGNRDAQAFGFAASTNNVKVVANQQ
jgi:hypothetical protein